jgi:hypothetical protein
MTSNSPSSRAKWDPSMRCMPKSTGFTRLGLARP